MAAPMNHHIALAGCMTNVAGGLPVCIAVDTDPDYLLRTIERHKVNIFFAFPHIYLAMYRAGLDRYDLSSMRMWMSGADAMHEVHIREFTRHGAFLRVAGKPMMGSLFMELLGTSEVGIVALMKISRRGTNLYSRCVGKRTSISPNVKVADETGRPLPAGQVGRLMVKGPTVFKGYWNEHHRLHGVVLDGWWWTGDLARHDRKGRFYQLDRDDDCIRTNAGPIYTLLVEEELLKHPDVHEAVVIGIPATDGGERPLIVLQAKEGRDAFDEPTALRWIAETIALPRPCTDVIVVRNDADLPRGLTGKILKRVVRDRYRTAFVAATPTDEAPISTEHPILETA
jgi:acyl-coenzyme A synthetase/AMP-(fatty) acid ligase